MNRLALIVLLIAHAASAQERAYHATGDVIRTDPGNPELEDTDLKADRPGFTDPPDTVGPGVVQFETGFALEQDRRSGKRTLTTPTPSFRLGISHRVELRVGGDGYIREFAATEDGGSANAGLSDLNLSLKIKLRRQTRRAPAITVIPALTAPTGHRDFTSAAFDPGAKLAVAKDVRGGFNIGVNAGLASVTEDGRRRTQTVLSGAASHTLGFGLSGFGELYQVRTTGVVSRVADAGVSHGIGRNAQVDLSLGRALTCEGPAWFISAGLVLREARRPLFHFHR